MKKSRAIVFGLVGALTLGLVASTVSDAAMPNVKTATLDCAPGWRAGAGGTYGGVFFDVTCKNGRGSARLKGPVGTAYTIRMGVEGEVGADCAWSGDSEVVSETCVAVQLTIR